MHNVNVWVVPPRMVEEFFEDDYTDRLSASTANAMCHEQGADKLYKNEGRHK